MTMTKQKLKIWLATNNYRQKELADILDITTNSISRYGTTDSKGNYHEFPRVFIWALKALPNKSK